MFKWIVFAVISLLALILLGIVFFALKKSHNEELTEEFDESFEATADLGDEMIANDLYSKNKYSKIELLEDVVVTHYRK